MKELSDEARKLKNAYLREWRKKNPEKVRKEEAAFWERKADPVGAKVRQLNKQGLTQRQISEAVGISLGKVNEILKATV